MNEWRLRVSSSTSGAFVASSPKKNKTLLASLPYRRISASFAQDNVVRCMFSICGVAGHLAHPASAHRRTARTPGAGWTAYRTIVRAAREDLSQAALRRMFRAPFTKNIDCSHVASSDFGAVDRTGRRGMA